MQRGTTYVNTLTPLRVLLIEDSPLIRERLFESLVDPGRIEIVGEADTEEAAVALVNDSPYGLTSAIHTASIHRAMHFADAVEAGVVVVNGGTHGSEPHMGFGGVKQSGNGWKEAGVEAIEVYSDVRYVNLISDPSKT